MFPSNCHLSKLYPEYGVAVTVNVFSVLTWNVPFWLTVPPELAVTVMVH